MPFNNLNFHPVLPSLVLHPQLQTTQWNKYMRDLMLPGILTYTQLIHCKNFNSSHGSFRNSHRDPGVSMCCGRDTFEETFIYHKCTCDLKSTVICSFPPIGFVHVFNYLFHKHVSQANGLKADTRLSITLAKQRVLPAVHIPQQELNTAFNGVTLVLNSGNRLL